MKKRLNIPKGYQNPYNTMVKRKGQRDKQGLQNNTHDRSAIRCLTNKKEDIKLSAHNTFYKYQRSRVNTIVTLITKV